MSLLRLGLAFAPVAVLFLCFAWIERRVLTRRATLIALSEAGATTLLGALWFGSLGAGGWANLFLVLGLLVGVNRRGPTIMALSSAPGYETLGLVLDLARYLGAGALLAWRLG